MKRTWTAGVMRKGPDQTTLKCVAANRNQRAMITVFASNRSVVEFELGNVMLRAADAALLAAFAFGLVGSIHEDGNPWTLDMKTDELDKGRVYFGETDLGMVEAYFDLADLAYPVTLAESSS